MIAMINFELRLGSSMVEQATHNRQVTGSNPVRANFFLAALCALVTSAQSAQAQDIDKPTIPAGEIPLSGDEFHLRPAMEPGLKVPQGQIISTGKEYIPGKPCQNCFAVRLRLINNSSDPIMVDGQKARLYSGSKVLNPWNENEVMKYLGSQYSGAEKLALGLAAVSTLGLAEPILQDHFTTSKTDFTVSYGTQERRRKLEEGRIAQRIILPTEFTEGYLLFPSLKEMPERLELPLTSYPEANPVTNLSLIFKQGQ